MTVNQTPKDISPRKNSGAIIKTALVLGTVALLVYVAFIYAAVSASG